MEATSNLYRGRISAFLAQKARIMHFPYSGTLELTPRCNMNCKMCYIRMTEQEMVHVGQELPADEWIRIAQEAVDLGMCVVLFTGGEAILYKDFKKVYLAVRKMGLFVGINSNGTLLCGEWLEFFRQNPPGKFNITLYGGSNETYQRLCGNPKGFDQVKANIEALLAIGIHVSLSCTVTRENADDIDAIFAFAREHDLHVTATTYNFPPVRKEGVEINEISRMDPKTAARARIHLDWVDSSRENFVRRISHIADHPELAEPSENHCVDLEGDSILCAAGRSNFWVTWDGRVLPCGMIPDFSVPVRGRSFKAAWDAVVAHTATIHLAPECRDCPKKKLCAPCAAKLKSETGAYHKRSEYLCQYVDEYIRLAHEAKRYLEHAEENR